MSQPQEPEISVAAYTLEQVMSDISEDCYAAGWMMDLGFDLWRIVSVSKSSRSYGMCSITDEQIEQLKWLACEAGGWWADYEIFCPMDVWLTLFAELESDYLAKYPDSK